MRLPGITRPGSWRMPIEPGALVETELPWVARFDEKWCRLIAPAKPLPIVTPVTSTFCPAWNRSMSSVEPALNSAAWAAVSGNSRSTVPASTPALA
jgi:hypothetical protein